MPDGRIPRHPLPLLTLAVVGAAGVLWVSGAGEAFVFDRVAIERGALWRLLTGNLVHFSAGHLLLDGTTLLTAGALIERRRRGELLVLLATSALACTLAVFLWESGTARFGGLSGVAVSAVVYAALTARVDHALPHAIAPVLVATVAMKVLADAVWPRAFVAADGRLVEVSVAAHVAGFAAAIVVHAAMPGRWPRVQGEGAADATSPSASARRPVARSSAA